MKRLFGFLVLAAACGGQAHPGAPSKPLALDSALVAADTQVAAHPGDLNLRRERGLLRWMNGDRLHGEEDLRAVVAIAPGDARALFGLAEIAQLAGRDAEAKAWQASVLDTAEAQPGDPWARALSRQVVEDMAAWAPDGQSAHVRERLLRTETEPLPGDVRAPALRALAVFEDARPDPAGAARVAAERGCVPAWKVTGPAPGGVMPHLRLLRPDAGPPVSPTGPTRVVPARGCEAVLHSPRQRPGDMVIETFLATETEKDVEIELEVTDLDALARVWVEGGLVLGRDGASRFLPDRVAVRAHLNRGVSHVVVELASLGDDLGVSLIVRDPETGKLPEGVALATDPTVRPAGVHAAAAQFQGAVPADVPPSISFADGVLADWLMGERALDVRSADDAAEALGRVTRAAPRWLPGWVATARLELDEPARPTRVARDEARRTLDHALTIDPGADRVRLAFAEMLLEDEDPQGALEALGDGDAQAHPITHWRAAWVRARALAEKGLAEEADGALAEAEKLSPDACPVISLELKTARERKNLAARRKAAEKLVACDGDSEALAYVAHEAGDVDAWIAERERLLKRAPESAERWVDAGRAYTGAGRRDEARARFQRAVELEPRSAAARLSLADLLAATGDRKGARAALEAGIAENPEARPLVDALVALGGKDPIDAWRIDGKQVIREFEAEEREKKRPPYDAPAVLVLDRTVMIVRPDGSRATLTHNIIKVIHKDGLDRWGEIRVPGGAELLMARTDKADGTTREPESLEKEGITAPDLAVGDYVEFEYLQVEGASLAFDGGFEGDRFYFGTFEAPLDRTELITVVPPAMQLEWDVRGDSPAPVVTRGPAGETVTTFAARHRVQLVAEPGGPPAAEYIASAKPYAHLALGAWRDWVAEQTYGIRRGDRALYAQAEALVAGKHGDLARAKALYDFVVEKIEEGGALSEEPTLILARRGGRRAVLFMALCEASGIPTELWLVRPRTSGQGAPPPSGPSELSYAIVDVTLGGQHVLVDPRVKWAPFGYLAPSVRGAPALPIPDPGRTTPAAWTNTTLVMTPADPTEPDERVVQLDVTLSSDGGAKIAVTETMTGVAAAGWREYLEQVPPDELQRDLEQRALGFYFPGSTLKRVSFTGRDRADVPLVIAYDFVAPRFARADGSGELAAPLSPMPLLYGRRFVVVGSRKTPLVLDVTPASRTSVRVHLPAGFTVDGALPAEVYLAAPDGAGRYRQAVSAAPDGFESRVDATPSPLARVAPDHYGEFVKYAAAVDAADARVVTLRRK